MLPPERSWGRRAGDEGAEPLFEQSGKPLTPYPSPRNPDSLRLARIPGRGEPEIQLTVAILLNLVRMGSSEGWVVLFEKVF